VSIGLEGVRAAARRDRKMRFTALLHHIDLRLLRDSFFVLKNSAVPGIDGLADLHHCPGSMASGRAST
jgi:hypothetical protein